MTRKFLAAALIFTLLLPSCAPGPKRYQTKYLTLFDTVTTITAYTSSQEAFDLLCGRIYAELEEYHRLYDIYEEYEGINNLKTVNDNAGKDAVQVDRRIIDLLLFAKEMYRRTDGRMNVAMGSVLSLWHAYREAGIADPAHASLPEREALEEAALHTDIGGLIIDEDACTVRLTDEKMRLDVGAVAKGYALEQAAASLSAQGISSVLLNSGGCIRAIGDKAGSPWDIGVQDPDSPEELFTTVSLSDGALSVSGGYQRYYIVGGQRYHHLIDPRTCYPASYYASVAVRAPSAAVADALSTALFLLPAEEAQALLSSFPEVSALFLPSDSGEWVKG